MIGLPANGIGGISRQVLGLSSFLPKSTGVDDDDGTNMVPSAESSFQHFLRQREAANQFEEIRKMFRTTQCPCCCITRLSPQDHYMSNCKTLK